jgi:hypothetical protein
MNEATPHMGTSEQVSGPQAGGQCGIDLGSRYRVGVQDAEVQHDGPASSAW